MSDELVLDPKKVSSTVLKRLIEEVRLEIYHEEVHGPKPRPSCYNRFHNRHFKSR